MSEVNGSESASDGGGGKLETYELWPQPIPLPEARPSAGGVHECDWPRETDPLAQGL